MAAIILAWALLISVCSTADARMTAEEYGRLPTSLKQTLSEVRKNCSERGYESAKSTDAGIIFVDLNHDDSRDIILDARAACSEDWMPAGGACSNRSCTLRVYKQVGPSQWELTLDLQIAPPFFLSIDHQRRFRLLALHIPGGLERCDGNSKFDPCDYLVRWRGQRWLWERVGTQSAPRERAGPTRPATEETDLLVVVLEAHDGSKTLHKQAVPGSQCDKALAAARKAWAERQPMQLTLTNPPATGYVVEVSCIRPDGSIREP